jgi:hypothetical protein
MTTITNAADRALEHVGDAASHVRKTLLEQVAKIVSSTRDAEVSGIDALLDRMGLQRRQSALRPVFWITAGAVAAGMAIFFMSPTSGKEARRRIASVLRGEAKASATQVKVVEAQGHTTCEEPSVQNGARHEAG